MSIIKTVIEVGREGTDKFADTATDIRFEVENSLKRKYIKVKSISQGSYYIDTLESVKDVKDMLYDCETENDGYELSIVYMTMEEFGNLTEFTGF